MAMTGAEIARRYRQRKLAANPHLRLSHGRIVDDRIQPRRRRLWAPCDDCESVHGTPGRYASRTNPCRCPDCTLAHSRYQNLTPESRAELMALRLEERIARLNAPRRNAPRRRSTP